MQGPGAAPVPGVAALPTSGVAAAPPSGPHEPPPSALWAADPVPPGCIRAALLNRRNLAELYVGRSEMAALRQLELTLRGEEGACTLTCQSWLTEVCWSPFLLNN